MPESGFGWLVCRFEIAGLKSNSFEEYAKTLKSDRLAYDLWVCVGCSPLSEPPEGAKRMLKPLKLQI